MALTPFAGFTHYETQHCVTGALRQIYAFYGHPVSEELLLGLGAGVGYIYWQQRDAAPFIGGRAAPKPSFEELAGQRTGVTVTAHSTTSPRRAEAALITLLEAGTPTMLQVDMGFLPYFDFGGEFHFGGHVVVACGYDALAGQVLLADRDAALHPVALADLARARGSTHRPFPPRHRWYTFDFAQRRAPASAEIYAAVAQQAEQMLRPPIANLGVPGIRTTARRLPEWPAAMDASALRAALFNAYISVSPVGGTGGGAFRLMLSRFLSEAAALTGDAGLTEASGQCAEVGVLWDAFGAGCHAASESPDPAQQLPDLAQLLLQIAQREEAVWRGLERLAQAAPPRGGAFSSVGSWAGGSP